MGVLGVPARARRGDAGRLGAADPRPERIAALQPFEIEISLHGDNPATHDAVTRVPGSFERLLQAFGDLKELRQRVKLKTPVTRQNQEQLKGIRAIGDRFGFNVMVDLVITPRDDGDTASDDGSTGRWDR